MYRKFRFYFRLFKAFLAKYHRTLIVGLVLGTLAFIFLPKAFSLLPQIRSTRRIAYVGRFSLGTLPQTIQHQISIGLTTLDETGTAHPGIATSWEATDSGRQYTFTLNTDLVWQDGKRLASSDIKYDFKDAQISYPDSSHLVIQLTDPYSPLPTILAQPVFKVTRPRGLFTQTNYSGLGTYRIQSYRSNGSVLESLVLTPARPDSQLPKLRYHFYPSQAAARTAFKLGLVQEIVDLQELGDLRTWPGVTQTSRVMADRYVAVFFDTQDPTFQGQAGKNLRLALSYAIDKDRWPHRIHGPISALSWAYEPDIRHYDLDLDRATNLLDKVEQVPEQLTLHTLPAYLDVAESIKTDWEQLGLAVDIKVTPDVPPDFQILLAAQAIPADPDQYNLWHSTKSTNLTHIKNPRIDKKLEDGRKTFDLKERQLLYSDFQITLVDEAAAIFLFSPETYVLTRN